MPNTMLPVVCAPNPDPCIVTGVPALPVVVETLEMFGMIGGGALAMVKVGPVVAIPPTVTTTLPLVAPPGTKTVINVGAQFNAGESQNRLIAGPVEGEGAFCRLLIPPPL
jgi:hypothetical protein